MSAAKASLWRRAAWALAAGLILALPMSAKADWLNGLSLRGGAFFPVRAGVRSITDFAVFGGGIEYDIPWNPRLFNQAGWTTSISADFHYSDRTAGIVRYIPVSINQIYEFEEQNGRIPYAGFCVTAATFGSSGTTPRQPTVTRFGGGLILGVNIDEHFFLEGRYEWIDSSGTLGVPEGFRSYFGYRF
jgi:hypothetical protein